MGFFSELFGVPPADCSIYVQSDGIFFYECDEGVPWSDVKSVEYDVDDSTYQFSLRGGLTFSTDENKIYYPEDDFREQVQNGDIELSNMAQCTHRGLCGELDIYDLKDANNRKRLAIALNDVLWASELADKIRESDNLTVYEGWLFSEYCCAYNTLIQADWQIANGAKFKNFTEVLNCIDAFISLLKDQLSRIDPSAFDENGRSQLAEIFRLPCLTTYQNPNLQGNGIEIQASTYDNIRNARAYGENIEEGFVAGLLAASEDGIGVCFGSSEWAKKRKTIICTNECASVETWREGLRIPSVMVMDAQDIEAYNASVSDEYRLVFESGHPQNGCTYIQHPFRKNRYFEVNSFHNAIREQKQNELLRILESLGAYSAHVQVRHEEQEQRKSKKGSRRSASGSYGVVSGSGSVNADMDRQSLSSMSQSALKDWTFNPPEDPCLPDDLVFYPTEETWQQLAKSVLRGGLKRAVVDLEYKSEYGITENYLSDIAASAKSLVPSFEMNLNSSFSTDLHKLTTTQWHYEVVFENESGERAGGKAKTTKSQITPYTNSDVSKAESLFAKRAKRYAQSEGHINAEQRADLEAFAQKYGIDEFRMEELIEEAFV